MSIFKKRTPVVQERAPEVVYETAYVPLEDMRADAQRRIENFRVREQRRRALTPFAVELWGKLVEETQREAFLAELAKMVHKIERLQSKRMELTKAYIHAHAPFPVGTAVAMAMEDIDPLTGKARKYVIKGYVYRWAIDYGNGLLLPCLAEFDSCLTGSPRRIEFDVNYVVAMKTIDDPYPGRHKYIFEGMEPFERGHDVGHLARVRYRRGDKFYTTVKGSVVHLKVVRVAQLLIDDEIFTQYECVNEDSTRPVRELYVIPDVALVTEDKK